MEMEKQMFDKQMFDGPCRDTVGHRQDFGFQGLLCFHTTHSPYSLQISLLIVEMLHLYQAIYLNYLDILQRREGGKKEVFLSFLFLGNNHPKIILMPKRHILMLQMLLTYSFPYQTNWFSCFVYALVCICITQFQFT